MRPAARHFLVHLSTVAAVVASAVLVVAPAHAATTLVRTGGTVTLTLGSPTSLLVEPYEDRFRLVSDEGISAGSGCPVGMFGGVECAGITHVVINGSTGADTFSLTGPLHVEIRAGGGNDEVYGYDDVSITAYGEAGDDTMHGGTGPNVLDGGDGNDTVHGGSSDDVISGGPGNDRLTGDFGHDTISGGPGNDSLMGDFAAGVRQPEDGNDVLDGGDGDDSLQGMGGSDTLRGGPGNDTAIFEDAYSANGSGVNFAVSLDGVANDGYDGEGDNIDADGSVEHMKLPGGGVAQMTVVGNDGPNNIRADGGTVIIDGRGGDDVIVANASGSGSKATVSGGAGNDSITSYGETSIVDGGPGDDTIYSGRGHDTVTGGPGKDTIDTGYGNDVIDTADGEVDTISCGVGADTVKADRIDVINQDPLALCESTSLVGPSAPGGPSAAPNQVTVAVKKKVKVSKKGVATFKVANGKAKKVTIAVVAKAKRLTLGTGRATIAGGAHGTIKLKLTKKARTYLKRHRKVAAKLTFTLVKGGPGKFSKKVKLVLK